MEGKVQGLKGMNYAPPSSLKMLPLAIITIAGSAAPVGMWYVFVPHEINNLQEGKFSNKIFESKNRNFRPQITRKYLFYSSKNFLITVTSRRIKKKNYTVLT